MMPNERRGRGRPARGVAVGAAGVVLVLLGAIAWSPLTSSAASAAPLGVGAPTSASSPGGSLPPGAPAPGASAAPDVPPGSPVPTASVDPAVLSVQLQQALDTARAKLSIPGVSVAILWDDGQTWLGASGLRNVAARDPMTAGTAFAFASISKTLTAAVVLELVQEGRLTLDQPVAPLLPKFKLDPRITLRMLLDHTSGLPDFFFGKGIDAALQRSPNATWTSLRSWGYVNWATAKKPGKAWLYSNTNYLLLGELVTGVTGRPLALEVRTRLLDPLGLTGAYYQAVEQPREPGTLAYRMLANSNGTWRVRPASAASSVIPFRSVVTAAAGAGSIAGTALDAARWMRAWAGGQVLGPDMQAQMLADVATTVKLHARIPYGLGIQQVTLNGYAAFGHSGQYLGIRDVVRYLPDVGLTIAVMTNQNVWDPTRIASALVKVIVPNAPTPSPSPTPSASPSPSPS
jgi:D-alanyl-D-alanine carboxypeptidase